MERHVLEFQRSLGICRVLDVFVTLRNRDGFFQNFTDTLCGNLGTGQDHEDHGEHHEAHYDHHCVAAEDREVAEEIAAGAHQVDGVVNDMTIRCGAADVEAVDDDRAHKLKNQLDAAHDQADDRAHESHGAHGELFISQGTKSRSFKLAVVQVCISAAESHEAVVGALLDDVAFLHHEDQVRVADGRKTVRDDERSAVRHQVIHGPLYQHFGTGIDGAGRLIEDQHRVVLDHRTGDGEQLLLTDGNVGVCSENGVKLLRQGFYEVVEAAGLADLFEVFVGDAFHVVDQVFANRAFKHPGVLKHQVINQSQGFNWYVNKYLKKDDQGNEYVEYDEVKKWWDDPLNFFDQTRIVTDLSDFFQRMIDNGYDFVIVTGAGNDSHPSIGHLDARYASWLTLIPRMVYTEVYDRIIVVGSVNEELQESWFTNGGSRVDIYAPGENIYSTYPTNEYASGSGTSMAAPHVAGVAAMVWSANNSLNGKQVKKAITENFSKNCSSCHMVDALRAVEYALAEKDTGKNTNAESGGVLCFVVEEGNETNRISNAAITLVNAETAVPYETVTDAEGHFEIMVPEGRYNLFVSAQGYEDYEWPKTSENLKFIEVRNGQINYLDRDIGDWIKMKRSGSTVNSSDPADENGEQPTKADPFGPGTGKTEETSSDPLASESNGYIIFGHYEQDNNTGNGKEPIEWEILDENANGKLLISRYVLDAVPFNNEHAEVTWETSSLREWLNKDFLNEAFTKDEQALIPKVRLENSGVEMPGGNATEDQVFCLSLDEAAKYYKFTYDKYSYFGFKKELITLPTEYAKAHGLKTFNAKECIDGPVGDEYWMDGYAPKGYQASIADLAGTYWWLRTMGWDNDVCAVFPNGFAGAHYESGVSSKSYGVRPVLWISNDAIKGEDETEPDAKPNLPEPYDGDGVAINAENFPDERFRSILLEDYDEDGNRVFSKEELEGIKRVEIDEEIISSLQGIEFFYNLQRLKCGTNKLTSLDISHNPKLKYLSCSNNPLSSLDVSRNTALEELYYSKTGLKEVDVSKNANLKVLYCMDNEMTSLDVSHNPKLKELGCRGNNLTSLDLSKNTELEKLYCSSNLLTTLDLSHNPKLKQLHCQVNELQALDPSHNPLLENIECFRNQLMELDLSNWLI